MNCRSCKQSVDGDARFCSACGTPLWDEDPAHQIARAYRHELEGNRERAIAAFEEMLDATDDPEHSSAIRKHVGNLHYRLGNLRRARYHLTAARETDPDNPTLLHDLGVVLYHLADFQGAIDALQHALSRDPDLQLAYFWLGNALYHRGMLGEAETAFRELLDRYPNFTVAHFHLGVIYERQGQREAAYDEFQRVLRKNPADAAARHYLEAHAPQ